MVCERSSDRPSGISSRKSVNKCPYRPRCNCLGLIAASYEFAASDGTLAHHQQRTP